MKFNNPYYQMPFPQPEMDDFLKQYKRIKKVNKLMAREKEEEKKAEDLKKKAEKKPTGMSAPQMFTLLCFGWPFVGLFQLYLLASVLTSLSAALKLIAK